MNTEASDLDAMFTTDVFDEWWFACDFDEGFACVAVLVEGADVAGGDGGGEGEGDCVLEILYHISTVGL